ncbi:ion channel, partial [Oryctes borbonicus]
PSQLPTQNQNYFRVPLNQAVFAAVSPEVIMTKKDLEAYTASERQCYFGNEKTLSSLNYYSRSNCEVECLIYLMETLLHCLDFYLPHKNQSIPICGAEKLEAIKSIEKILVTYISNTTLLNLQLEDLIMKALIEGLDLVEQASNYCDCLPSCRSIEYSFETTQTDYYWYHFGEQERLKDKEYRSLINIHFKDAYYIPMQREEMFGAMDFIAYSGGLLGLFIGFSFISSVEIVYFLTLRIACNVQLFGRKMCLKIEFHKLPKYSNLKA